VSRIAPEDKPSKPCQICTHNIQALIQLATTTRKSLEQQLEELRTSITTATEVMTSLSSKPKETLGTSETLHTIAQSMESAMPTIDQMVVAIKSGHFLYSWMTVMLVTFAEAYLEDVLNSLISQSLVSSTLPDAIKDEITKKWVKDALRIGRPNEWIKQLAKFGITGYPSDMAGQLLIVWQRRHTIVHTAQPEIPNTAPQQFLDATKLVAEFMKTTDDQFLTICPSARAV
jgi:hypothetical protein